MTLTIDSKIEMNNGVKMPLYGLGTYLSAPGDPQTVTSIKHAISVANIIHIDTAQFYANEKEVGEAIKASGVPREKIFITTKLASTKDGRQGAIDAIEHSLKSLQSDYIDQYLLHAPAGGKILECYDVLLEYQKRGVIKTVGVSNFGVEHLEALKNSGRPLPQVNQIQMHPWFTHAPIVNWCQQNKVAIVGYCPLVRGKKLQDPFVLEMANKYGKTPAQILVRWSLQKGFVTIPKSVKEHRIDENANVFDFCIEDADMLSFEELAKLNENCCGQFDPTTNDMDTEFGPRK